jgi:hypothetical protein
MNGDYLTGQGNDADSKTSGRWSKEEHLKFMEGNYYYLVSVNTIYYSYEDLWQGLEES